ncbi:MAG: hypothetical protein V1833_05195 [Elusimicrobiota bacterium]
MDIQNNLLSSIKLYINVGTVSDRADCKHEHSSCLQKSITLKFIDIKLVPLFSGMTFVVLCRAML